MQVQVRYLSRSGNTEQVARAIAQSVGVHAHTVTVPLPEQVDLLFLGGAVYGFDVDPKLKDFIRSIPRGSVKKVALFSTAALVKEIPRSVKKELEACGFSVVERAFHCPGHYLMLKRGRPDKEDLSRAGAFAAAVVKELGQ